MMHEAAVKEALAEVQQRQALQQGITMYGQSLGQGAGQGHGQGPGQGMGQGMMPGMGHEMGPGVIKGQLLGQGLIPGLRQGSGPGPGQPMGPGFGQGQGPGFSMGQGQGPLSVSGQQGQATGEPVVDLRNILPELNLGNNSVEDVNANVGDVAHLPCRFPQLSTLHQVSDASESDRKREDTAALGQKKVEYVRTLKKVDKKT